jgi:hypothetical protein
VFFKLKVDVLYLPIFIFSDILARDVEQMRNIFPDCDPNYLYERLDSMKDEAGRTNVLAAKMFEEKNYPKLADLLQKEKEKEKSCSSKARYSMMTVEEFLQKFPDPAKTFNDKTKELSENYKSHCKIVLENEFPMFKSSYLTNVFTKYDGHLLPAYQEVSCLLLMTPLGKSF